MNASGSTATKKIKRFYEKGATDMLSCALCGRALRECCDLFHEAVTEDGETVIVCNDCALENDLQLEPENAQRPE
jgi:hypothetical protein